MKVETLSTPTIIKYIGAFSKYVKENIERRIAGNVSVLLDGWTHGDTHYLELFSSYPDVAGPET